MKIGYIGTLSEDDLIKKCIIGERSAQQSLYSRYSPKMFAVCLRYAKDYHSAEDILQEGFIKVYRYIAKFRREGSFEGWMRRIFVNTAIEHLRKSVSMYSITDEDGRAMNILDENVFDHLDYQDLLEMIQRLSPGYRTIFNLYVIEGYPHKEIANMLGISEGTSKSQLARARFILKNKIEASKKTVSYSVS